MERVILTKREAGELSARDTTNCRVQSMKWISVKERLPENDDMVLVWNKDDVQFGRWRSDVRQWTDYTEYLRHVTHWMPKPGNPNNG